MNHDSSAGPQQGDAAPNQDETAQHNDEVSRDDADIDAHLTDAPQNLEARAAQEKLWAETNVDARTHFSDRENNRHQQGRIVETISYYRQVQNLVLGFQQEQVRGRENLLQRLSSELLSAIMEMVQPGTILNM